MCVCAVYHAVYMDCVGVEELKCKLALLFGIQASQIGDIFMLGPSAIHIMVTDEVSHVTLVGGSIHIMVTDEVSHTGGGVHPYGHR